MMPFSGKSGQPVIAADTISAIPRITDDTRMARAVL
jgi:hypothetical protein